MSRVGKRPIPIPAGVTATCTDNHVTIAGPKGKLDYTVDKRFAVAVDKDSITVKSPSNDRLDSSQHGLIRTLIQNMIIGTTEGYSRGLQIHGVGFKAQAQGTKIVLNLGYSHPIQYDIPAGVAITVPKPTQLVVSGIDKSKVGEVAAELRSLYLPEPYKGKGMRYEGEQVKRKAGKTVA